jgi:hypothetical protein
VRDAERETLPLTRCQPDILQHRSMREEEGEGERGGGKKDGGGVCVCVLGRGDVCVQGDVCVYMCVYT